MFRTVALMVSCAIWGGCCGALADQYYMRHAALEANAAHYDPHTGEFSWGTIYTDDELAPETAKAIPVPAKPYTQRLQHKPMEDYHAK